MAEDRQPAGREVLLASGAEHEVPVLVLAPGVAIAGRVLYRGRGVAQAYVSAEPTDDEMGLPLEVGGRQVHWSPGPVLRSGGEGTTDDDGAFRVVGLSPGSYSVGVWSVSLPEVDDVSPALSNRLGGTLEAPADGAVIEIEGALLELRTTHAGRAVGKVGLQVSVSGSSSMWETQPDAGVLRVLVPPAVELAVRVTDDRYVPTTTTVTSGAAGTTVRRDLPLVEAAPRPSLLATFEGPGAAALEEAWFQAVPRGVATPTDPGGGPPVPAPPSGMLDVEKVEPGTFRVRGMPPGPCTLIVRPGTGFWEDAGYHLEIRQDVVVPAEGELAVRLTLRTGGRLRIAARDAAGALLEADCAIRDGRGAEQDVTFSTQSDHVAMTQGGALGGLSPSLVAPPLPVGRYTIDLAHDGYEPKTVVVEVKAGETAEVDVVLLER